MPRPRCAQCGYPCKACICRWVSTFKSDTKFHILQHPNEAKAAKNTARLVKLCLTETTIWPGESEDDFIELKKLTKTHSASVGVIYPSSNAIELLSHTTDAQTVDTQTQKMNFDTILIIDATWRKAYRMWQLNTWLRRFTALKFEGVETLYRIRQSSVSHSLSTLECIYHYLTLVEANTHSHKLMELFLARQKFSQAQRELSHSMQKS